MRVADYIVDFFKKKKINNIFMLTGYGAMYLNDAVKVAGIKYYATRNEATAPIMASAYSQISNKIGMACVTAGPGSTNAIPGLAEAYVDSCPVIIISGQVDYKHTTFSTKSKKIRTFGTAEINIVPIVNAITKYSTILKNPNETRYVLEKAFYLAKEGRPGPVWIDVPLDVQKSIINVKNLKKFKINSIASKKSRMANGIEKTIKLLKKSSRPLLVVGNGFKKSQNKKILSNLIKNLKIPVLFSRFANDMASHNKKYIMGLGGIKGSSYCREIMMKSDLVISLGCRFSPQFVGHEFKAFENAKIISVDVEQDELKKKGQKIDLKLNFDLSFFVPEFLRKTSKLNSQRFKKWVDYCETAKRKNSILNSSHYKNPIDLYYFMDRLGNLSKKNDILITDAGSNYYIGGQVWKFNKGQKEVCSVANAAMGLSIPLSIGSAIASPNSNVLAVTGDGSLELNIQELKTISHYDLNIKLFVINNGGYVSMHNWAETFFDGRRLDTPKETGDGTLNLKNIAKAFDLNYYLINDYRKIDKDLKIIMKSKKPLFIEVITNNNQRIFDAFKDH